MQITKIEAVQILDSRGNPTISVRVFAGETFGEFAVPSGASTGLHEAVEKRDGDKNYFRALSVLKAIEGISRIEDELTGINATKQAQIDQILKEIDGTSQKRRLGANVLIGVSIACAKLAANLLKQPLFEYLRTLDEIKSSQKVPCLFMNLINGGKHAQSKLAFQEYMIVSLSESVDEALNFGTLILNDLKKLIVQKLGPQSANIGDEGGFVLDTDQVILPLELLQEVIEKNNLADKVKLALDVAASSFYQKGQYLIGNKKLTSGKLLEEYVFLIKQFPIISIEDPFFEEDFDSFAGLLKQFKGLVAGDDLTVTSSERLKHALDKKSINAIIIKPNQVGTLTETLKTMKLARDNDIECIISHRSGETNDDFIADLAFAFGCFGLKSGAPQRGERVAKYNRLNLITK